MTAIVGNSGSRFCPNNRFSPIAFLRSVTISTTSPHCTACCGGQPPRAQRHVRHPAMRLVSDAGEAREATICPSIMSIDSGTLQAAVVRDAGLA
jgi:hypothetical protein